MNLKAIVDGRVHVIEVSPELLAEAEEFFGKMDRDMDRGWQMSREFIEDPDPVQRCQIAANKLLTSLSTGNQNMTVLMAGYILKKLPRAAAVRIDTAGEMLATEFLYEDAAAPPPPRPAAAAPAGRPLSRLEALDRAGADVSKVYRAGRGYRYAVRDPRTGAWAESPLIESEQEAVEQRLHAFKRRLDELTGAGP